MSEQNPIRVFVTHTFSEHPDYFRVFEYLESAPNFFYINCSAPDQIPGGGGKEAVKEALREQIKPSEVVIVLGGMYAEHRDWLTYQMDAAQAFEKPLVALEPFGGVEELAPAVAERAELGGAARRRSCDRSSPPPHRHPPMPRSGIWTSPAAHIPQKSIP